MTKQDFLFDKNFCNANKFKLFMRFAIYVQIFHTLHPFIERSEVMLGQGGFESWRYTYHYTYTIINTNFVFKKIWIYLQICFAYTYLRRYLEIGNYSRMLYKSAHFYITYWPQECPLPSIIFKFYNWEE